MQNSELYRKPLSCDCDDKWNKPYLPPHHHHEPCYDLDRLYEMVKSLVIGESEERREVDKKLFGEIKHLQKHLEKTGHDVEGLKRAIKEFWDLIPEFKNLVTKDFLLEMLGDYYTKENCEYLFATAPIPGHKIMRAADDVFNIH